MSSPNVEKAKDSAALAEPGSDEVLAALGRVLSSSAFRGSRRCQDFLSFVVTKSLEGDLDFLKERVVAVQVFGRKLSADLSGDTIVRVGAREVRKRLAQYYVAEGSADPVRIDMPLGCYAPKFHWQGSSLHLEHGEEVTPIPASPESQIPALLQRPGGTILAYRRPVIQIAAITVIILLAITGLLLFLSSHRRLPKEFDAFWSPALSARGPVEIIVPHPIVYFPTERAHRLHQQHHPQKDEALQVPLDVPSKELTGADFVPVFQQYVGFGDLVASSKLTQLFGSRDKDTSVRMASKTQFADMRNSAIVLVGAFTNRWTIEVTRSFRYHFRLDVGNRPTLVDSQTGQRQWAPEKKDNGSATEDYILVARLPKSNTGGIVYVGAGLTNYGTEEVGRILTDPQALAPLLRRLPLGWENKNVELVLHSQIVGETSTVPDLIAFYVW